MKNVFISIIVFCSALFADIESSVKIPASLHYQSTFGNHKNHPVQKMRIQQYWQSLSPLKADAVEAKLREQGLNVGHLVLKDYNANLVYEADAMRKDGTRLQLLIDPANGKILEQKEQL